MGKFAVDLSRIVEKSKISIDTAVQKVTMDIFKSIIMKTPVGNPELWQSPPRKGYVGGSARANWVASVDSYDSSLEIDGTDPRGSTTVNKAASVVLSTKAGHVVYLINNLPYIRALEHGWSTQAPSGMVKLTVTEYQSFMNKSAPGF